MTSSRCKKARECAPEPSGWIGVDEDVDRLEVATSIRLRQRKLARRWLPPCPNQRPRDESESASSATTMRQAHSTVSGHKPNLARTGRPATHDSQLANSIGVHRPTSQS